MADAWMNIMKTDYDIDFQVSEKDSQSNADAMYVLVITFIIVRSLTMTLI